MNKDNASKITSVIVFILAVPGLIFLIFKNYILANNLFGIIVQVLAAGLMIWARITFGLRSFHPMANTTKGRLVTNGPYRLLRHPIYDSIIYFLWAGVLCYRTLDSILVTIFISLCLITRMLLEERFLMATYEEYNEYCKRTYRLIPFIF